MTQTLMVRRLGTKDYLPIWQQMQQFTEARTPATADEIWLLQHPSVFTQGLAGKPEHLLNPGAIPIVQTDRGGQVTYHGPGQLLAYTLLDLNRLNLGTRQLVTHLENAIIGFLAEYGLQAEARRDAPGVYVNDAKIASIGLRIRKGFSYHGIALNIDMDLEPFRRINPCGYSNMPIQQLSSWVNPIDWVAIEAKIIHYLAASFHYQTIEWEPK